jgi:hypothetical protein
MGQTAPSPLAPAPTLSEAELAALDNLSDDQVGFIVGEVVSVLEEAGWHPGGWQPRPRSKGE